MTTKYDYAESERYETARRLLMAVVTHTVPNKPGALILRLSHLPRLDELKSHHFNHRVQHLLSRPCR